MGIITAYIPTGSSSHFFSPLAFSVTALTLSAVCLPVPDICIYFGCHRVVCGAGISWQPSPTQVSVGRNLPLFLNPLALVCCCVNALLHFTTAGPLALVGGAYSLLIDPAQRDDPGLPSFLGVYHARIFAACCTGGAPIPSRCTLTTSKAVRRLIKE